MGGVVAVELVAWNKFVVLLFKQQLSTNSFALNTEPSRLCRICMSSLTNFIHFLILAKYFELTSVSLNWNILNSKSLTSCWCFSRSMSNLTDLSVEGDIMSADLLAFRKVFRINSLAFMRPSLVGLSHLTSYLGANMSRLWKSFQRCRRSFAMFRVRLGNPSRFARSFSIKPSRVFMRTSFDGVLPPSSISMDSICFWFRLLTSLSTAACLVIVSTFTTRFNSLILSCLLIFFFFFSKVNKALDFNLFSQFKTILHVSMRPELWIKYIFEMNWHFFWMGHKLVYENLKFF